MEDAHRVRASANGGNDRVRQPAFGVVQLRPRLLADDALEVSHHGRIQTRPGHSADQVVGVGDVGDPVAERVVHRVLERAGAAADRVNICSEQAHAKHVRLLPLDVGGTHVDDALEAEQGAHSCRGDAMLSGAGFGDDSAAAHAARQQDLAHDVVELVRARVIEFLTLEVDARPAQGFGQSAREPERARTADIITQMLVKVAMELRIGLGGFVGHLQFEDQRHQRLRDEAAAEDAEAAAMIGPLPQTVGGCLGTNLDAHRGSPIQGTS